MIDKLYINTKILPVDLIYLLELIRPYVAKSDTVIIYKTIPVESDRLLHATLQYLAIRYSLFKYQLVVKIDNYGLVTNIRLLIVHA